LERRGDTPWSPKLWDGTESVPYSSLPLLTEEVKDVSKRLQ